MAGAAPAKWSPVQIADIVCMAGWAQSLSAAERSDGQGRFDAALVPETGFAWHFRPRRVLPDGGR